MVYDEMWRRGAHPRDPAQALLDSQPLSRGRPGGWVSIDRDTGEITIHRGGRKFGSTVEYDMENIKDTVIVIK